MTLDVLMSQATDAAVPKSFFQCLPEIAMGCELAECGVKVGNCFPCCLIMFVKMKALGNYASLWLQMFV